jgi:tRNA threonylcarbamoyladenosine biosynthesis protein TsaB
VNILALDTSTEACSAALLREDGVIFSEFEIAPRQHTKLLPVMMDTVLSASTISKQSISHCAFTNGPGSFTGIRIATAQAQGVGLALGIPLLPVSTLAVLAQVCLDQNEYNDTLVALDARMQEIYWAHYRRDGGSCARLVGTEQLSAVGDVDIDVNIECGAGHGWLDELRGRVDFPVDINLLPTARSLLKLAIIAMEQGLAVDARQVGINYLRNQVAEKART